MSASIHPIEPTTQPLLALALRRASCEPWQRPLGELGEDLTAGVVGMIRAHTAVEPGRWACGPGWAPIWDALVLAVASEAGIWTDPLSGFHIVHAVLSWERAAGCARDVRRVLRTAASLVEDGATTTACPACWITVRGSACATCGGSGTIALRPDRWRRMSLILGGEP